jgi:hypothetical protein
MKGEDLMLVPEHAYWFGATIMPYDSAERAKA